MSQDRELDDYLQGKNGLSRLYADTPQVEPPGHLDAAILAEAHRAVNARPGARPKRRWAVPLGLVASLFAVVMIGLQLPYLLKEAVPLQAPAEEQITAVMGRSAAEPAPAARINESRKMQSMDKARSEIANQPAPQKAEASIQPAAPVVAAPMAAMPAPAMAAKRAEMKESAASANTGALLQEKKSADVGGSSTNDALKQLAPASAGVASLSAQPERELMKDGSGKASLRPEDWLTRIGKLKQEGKLEEFRKELQAFKKRYPDYPVPAGIADK
jgi:hypothetical protein